MALFTTCEAKDDAPGTQKTEDEENGYLEWFSKCIGWRKPWRATPERRLIPSDRLNFKYAGTSQSTVLSSGLSMEASVAGGSESSPMSYACSKYYCCHKDCKEIRTVPGLIDWHYEKKHKDGYAATRQEGGPTDSANLSQEATKTNASGLHITNKPKVLSILSCKVGGYVEAFVQSEEQGTTKQWPQLYSLGEFCELSYASVVLEEFIQNFS